MLSLACVLKALFFFFVFFKQTCYMYLLCAVVFHKATLVLFFSGPLPGALGSSASSSAPRESHLPWGHCCMLTPELLLYASIRHIELRPTPLPIGCDWQQWVPTGSHCCLSQRGGRVLGQPRLLWTSLDQRELRGKDWGGGPLHTEGFYLQA